MSAPAVETITLLNGIRIVVLDSGDEEVTRITVSWEGGRNEAESLETAILLAATFKDGSIETGIEEMADLLDSSGAWVTSELHPHHMSLNIFTINSTLHRVLPAIISAINEPLFSEQTLEATRAQVVAGIMQNEKRVSYQAKKLEDEALYGTNHPTARVTTAEDIMKVTRQDIITQYNHVYRHQPPVIYITGHVNDTIKQIILRSFEKLLCTPTSRPSLNVIPFTPLTPATKKKEMPEALQSAIRISIPTIPRSNPEYETVRLVTTALGGYFGSRLMSVIRENKGLTYNISASLLGHHEGSYMTIASQCDNAYTSAVITETLNEIHRLATESMDSNELITLRRHALSTLAATFDTPFSTMDYFIAHRHSNTPADYLERQQKAIIQLTPEKVMETTSKYFDKIPKFISIAGKNIN